MIDTITHKRALRRQILSARAALTPADLARAAAGLARQALLLPELAGARTVAAYVSVGAEPGTGPLLDALRERGVRVLLPVLRADDDLDWGAYRGADHLVPGRRGLREPDGERYGRAAVTRADAVLLPALAVDLEGGRLGRGGGSYDRVLARCAEAGARPALIALVYAHELVERVPREPHDRLVRAVVTPERGHGCRPAGGGTGHTGSSPGGTRTHATGAGPEGAGATSTGPTGADSTDGDAAAGSAAAGAG